VGQTWANDIIALPVLGKPVSVPRRSNEKVLLMHVDDVADIFVQLCLRETLRHTVYHTGGSLCTVGELANMVKEFVPEAQISFNEQAPDIPAPYLVDNSRMKQELGIHLRTLREGVIELLNAIRCEASLAPIAT